MKEIDLFTSLKLKLKKVVFSYDFNWSALKHYLIHPYALFIGCIFIFNLLVGMVVLNVHAAPEISTLQSQEWKMEHNSLSSIGENLNDANVKLAVIENNLKTNRYNAVDLKMLAGQLSDIRQSVNAASQTSQSALAQEILLSSQAVQTQLTTIQQQLIKLQQHSAQTIYLPMSSLSFSVLHIDNIQGNAVVTVDYNHTNFPLMIGDTLTGFNLIHADFATQTAIFQNTKQQRVKVQLGTVSVQPRSSV